MLNNTIINSSLDYNDYLLEVNIGIYLFLKNSLFALFFSSMITSKKVMLFQFYKNKRTRFITSRLFIAKQENSSIF